MPEEVLDAEIVDEPGTALEIAAPAPTTLFRSDNPSEIVRRATEVANELSKVLRDKQLISNIGGREHVRVEGWTLCGTMLGVFPVCEWTRKLDDGWEARVEARTLAGAVVGAAEAECLRSENNWKTRDDYALRSMAQTRATSKALRQPLGFIIQLAGFEPTPAEEMPSPENSRSDNSRSQRVEGPGAYPVPKSWAKVQEGVRACDNPDEAWALFEAFARAASYHLFGHTDSKELDAAQRKTMLQKAAGAVVALHDVTAKVDGPFVIFDRGVQEAAWAVVLDGVKLETPGYVAPVDAEQVTLDEEARRQAEAEA